MRERIRSFRAKTRILLSGGTTRGDGKKRGHEMVSSQTKTIANLERGLAATARVWERNDGAFG